MKIVAGIIGMLVLVMGSGHVPATYAQQAAQPTVDLILTETLNRIAVGTSPREDLREVPAPRPDKLSDTPRFTVTVGNPQCFPGEDGGVVPPRSARRPARSR